MMSVVMVRHLLVVLMTMMRMMVMMMVMMMVIMRMMVMMTETIVMIMSVRGNTVTGVFYGSAGLKHPNYTEVIIIISSLSS